MALKSSYAPKHRNMKTPQLKIITIRVIVEYLLQPGVRGRKNPPSCGGDLGSLRGLRTEVPPRVSELPVITSGGLRLHQSHTGSGVICSASLSIVARSRAIHPTAALSTSCGLYSYSTDFCQSESVLIGIEPLTEVGVAYGEMNFHTEFIFYNPIRSLFILRGDGGINFLSIAQPVRDNLHMYRYPADGESVRRETMPACWVIGFAMLSLQTISPETPPKSQTNHYCCNAVQFIVPPVWPTVLKGRSVFQQQTITSESTPGRQLKINFEGFIIEKSGADCGGWKLTERLAPLPCKISSFYHPTGAQQLTFTRFYPSKRSSNTRKDALYTYLSFKPSSNPSKKECYGTTLHVRNYWSFCGTFPDCDPSKNHHKEGPVLSLDNLRHVSLCNGGDADVLLIGWKSPKITRKRYGLVLNLS
ncbi:hypothetical protein J6590_047668 [Homalodisca vitripennis]|nr:hypothetical protein J6590_047668 [Homalodisca vitripennis]